MALKIQSLSRYILYFLFLGNILQYPNCVSAGKLVEFPAVSVHELLYQYGFPRGLMPRYVKDYSLSADGTFEVELEGICYVQFKEQFVYYDTHIRGKIKHGSVFILSGIQTKKYFFWVPITGINADEKSGMLEVHVGVLSEKLMAKQFQKIRNCEKKKKKMDWNENGVQSI